MKIGAISDLHVDRHPKLEQDEYLNVLSQVIQHRKLDILLIAGDISNDYQMSYHFIKQLRIILIFRHIIPGNHDLWSDDSDKTSTEILDYTSQKKNVYWATFHY